MDVTSDETGLGALKTASGLSGENLTLERAAAYGRARLLARTGRWDEAREAYQQLIALDPNEPWIYWDLAEAHRALDDRHETGLAFLTAADKHLSRGETDKVLRAYQQAAAVAPNDPQVQAKLGDPPVVPAAPVSDEPPTLQEAAVSDEPAALAEPEAADGPTAPSVRAPRSRTAGKSSTLGQVLLNLGIINEPQLNEALEIQARTGERIGHIMLEMGTATEADLARGMAEQWGYPYMALADTKVDTEIAKLIPHALAVRHKCVPLEKRGGRLLLAIADPLNVIAVDDVRLITGLEVDLAVATEEDISSALNRTYQFGDALIERVMRDTVPDFGVEIGEEDPSLDQLKALTEEAPVIKLVNLTIDEAVKQGASDIHVEPQRTGIWIRYRVDGVLRDVMNPPKHLKAAITSRLKIMAEMDIAERRRPQDGRIHLIADGRSIDLRVSTLPTMFGEKVVMRVLDQSTTKIGLPRLGFQSNTLALWESAVSKPHGMVLVTGPTGSGKTTTLYATLGKLNTLDRNIVTIEDPVEYQLSRVNQVQVNAKAGLTFAGGLRSILRQDPDIVMVGEIRDRETAEIAVQAALTGHLVLSTLHTNDAAGAITRLVDMGIEGFLISSSVIAVLAQRLARTICPRCKVAYSPPAEALGRLGADARVDPGVVFYRGQGCDHCRGNGYRGRIGVYELLVISDTVRSMIVQRASSTEIKAQAIREGMRTLRDDGLEKVMAGVSTIDEILRVVYVAD
ncbi:MAG: type II secretion system ATPase GspE [bacterium]|nr:type II secretion system ATPase GspE [bacterium]